MLGNKYLLWLDAQGPHQGEETDEVVERCTKSMAFAEASRTILLQTRTGPENGERRQQEATF